MFRYKGIADDVAFVNIIWGALFEVIRKVACAQIRNMRMELRISLSDRSQYHSHVADLRTRNFANDFK
jgi:hypothetical protein